MQKAIIRLTSVTYAIRAQKLLERQGIRSTIKKFARSLEVNGCGYGVEIDKMDLDKAAGILKSADIRIVAWE
ncbi:MAG: DUF3343 domain-containing protein [Oscillospiraceae bacterium]|nr:DUF3343 domain-containing protein [Oscillospiraceae bacterium]